MPFWKPKQVWLNQDVFIIGGGNSLKLFDWNLLKSELTIGCNDAYKHGSEITKLCIFGDLKWFNVHKQELLKYEGVLFTNAPSLCQKNLDWVWTMDRNPKGLHKDALGWNGNTGAAAINLALLLGAKRVFLLGFDMHLSKGGKSNWHDNNIDKPDAEIYPKFLEGFDKLYVDLPKKFPEAKIFNVTDNSSLELFPKLEVEKFWKDRKTA